MFIYLVILSVTFLLGAVGIFLVLRKPSGARPIVKREPDIRAPVDPARDALLGVTRLILEWRREGKATEPPRGQSSTDEEDGAEGWNTYVEILGKNALAAAASGESDYRFVGIRTRSADDAQQEAGEKGPCR